MKKVFFVSMLFVLLLASCDNEKVTSLVLSERVKVMTMGDTAQLEVSVYPLAATRNADITWESSNESVVSVSDNGTIRALTPGEAVVGAICDKVYAECKITVLAVKADFSFHTAILYFLGDAYKKGTNNVILRLLDDGLEHKGSGVVEGEGFFLNISLNQSKDDTLLVAGTFNNDTTGKAMTFFPGSNIEKYAPGSYLGQLVAQSLGAIFIKSGSCVVDKNADEYAVNVSFLGEKGEVISGSFKGEIAAFDASETDVEEKTMTFSSATAQETSTEGGSKQMMVMLKNDTDSLQLLFNVALSASNAIPIGDYSISESGAEFSLTKGSLLESSCEGSWLLGAENSPFVSGDVLVANNNSKYTLTYNLRYENTRITGSYSGNIKFLN